MSFTNIAENLSGVRGTFFAEDEDYIYYIDDAGNLNRWLTVPSKIVQRADDPAIPLALLKNSDVKLDGGAAALRWALNTSNKLQLNAKNGAKIFGPIKEVPVNLSDPQGPKKLVTSLADIPPAYLEALTYSTSAVLEDGTSVAGKYYAVKTGSGNYVKVRVFYASGATRYEYVTFNPTLQNVGKGFVNARDLVIAKEEGETVVYVAAENDLYRATRSSDGTFPLVGSIYNGFTNAQQVVLFGGNIYVVDDNKICVIDQVTQQPEPSLFEGSLSGAVGLLITKDGKTAYISEAGSGGRLRVATLDPANPVLQPNPILPAAGQPGLGAVGHLTWVNADETEIYLTQRAPINAVLRISGLSEAPKMQEVISSLNPDFPENPWSVQPYVKTQGRDQVFVAADGAVGTFDVGLPPAGNLVLGIGFVPLQSIVQSGVHEGKADTTSENAQGYFFKVVNVPFGGSLHLLLNHKKAFEAPLQYKYYQVKLTKVGSSTFKIFSDPFSDLVWSDEKSRFLVEAIKRDGEYYEVRDPSRLWYNPYLGSIINTRLLAQDGLYTLSVTFFNASKVAQQTIEAKILIDNNVCTAKFGQVLINGQSITSQCGCFTYGAKTDVMTIPITATHPNNTADYSLSVYGGGKLRFSTTGSVDPAPAPVVKTVGEILGQCKLGNVSVNLSVSTRVTDGYRWVSNASTGMSFTLVSNTVPLEDP